MAAAVVAVVAFAVVEVVAVVAVRTVAVAAKGFAVLHALFAKGCTATGGCRPVPLKNEGHSTHY